MGGYMNEGRFIISSFALFLSILGTIAILFTIESGVMQPVLVVLFIIAGIASLRRAQHASSGWLLATIVFSAIILNLLYLGLTVEFSNFLGLIVLAGIVGLFASVSGIGHTKRDTFRKKVKIRSRRDSVPGEVTIQPIKELKEGEVLPGTKKAELKEYKTNVLYDTKAPVLNPKYAGKVKAKVSSGKYVASITGKTYHVPECPQAKRIKASNKTWIKDKADARKRKYKKHTCV